MNNNIEYRVLYRAENLSEYEILTEGERVFLYVIITIFNV